MYLSLNFIKVIILQELLSTYGHPNQVVAKTEGYTPLDELLSIFI